METELITPEEIARLDILAHGDADATAREAAVLLVETLLDRAVRNHTWEELETRLHTELSFLCQVARQWGTHHLLEVAIGLGKNYKAFSPEDRAYLLLAGSVAAYFEVVLTNTPDFGRN